MKKFICYKKLSKKEKRKLDTAKRRGWNDFGLQNPASRVICDRKKEQSKRLCRARIKEEVSV